MLRTAPLLVLLLVLACTTTETIRAPIEHIQRVTVVPVDPNATPIRRIATPTEYQHRLKAYREQATAEALLRDEQVKIQAKRAEQDKLAQAWYRMTDDEKRHYHSIEYLPEKKWAYVQYILDRPQPTPVPKPTRSLRPQAVSTPYGISKYMTPTPCRSEKYDIGYSDCLKRQGEGIPTPYTPPRPIPSQQAVITLGCGHYGNVMYEFTEDLLTFADFTRKLKEVESDLRGTPLESTARAILGALNRGDDVRFAKEAKALARSCLSYLTSQ